VRLGGQTRRVSRVRSKIAWRLSREYGIPLAEIARDLGVYTSAIAKAVRKMEGKVKKCKFSTTSPASWKRGKLSNLFINPFSGNQDDTRSFLV
jgi:hypothetical protein